MIILNVMKISHFLPLICLFVNTVSAQVDYWHYQTPYDLSFKKDIITGGISLFSGITGYSIEKNEDLPSYEIGWTKRLSLPPLGGVSDLVVSLSAGS